MPPLDGQVALITGGSRGVGLATALRLAGLGAAIALVARDQGRLAEARERTEASGGRALALAADVSDADAMRAAVALTERELGGLDVLINNAGIAVAQPFLRHEQAAWDRTLAINLTAGFVLGQLAARAMVAQGTGGAIVNMASTNGLMGERGLAAYNASKAGVVLLTKTMAIELAAHGIRVNCVAPGWIATELHEEVQLDPALVAAYMDKIPLRRAGRPEEVANVFAFLASEEAGFVTGESVVVDGGQLAEE
jgi:3-oxoacyl-[acyl-carrier protein] reductase